MSNATEAAAGLGSELSSLEINWKTAPYVPVFFALLYGSYTIFQSTFRRSPADDIPWGLSYMKYLPRWISGHLHSRYAMSIMSNASRRHPGMPFRLPRHDVDLIVLPEDMVDELAGLSNATASNLLALAYDLVGGWSGLGMLKDADLHRRVVRRRITPNLPDLTGDLEGAVRDCFATELPAEKDGWVEINSYNFLNSLAARVFSPTLVGKDYCRNEQWLDFAMHFTENVFKSVIFMRHFPPWMYPFWGFVLPSVRNAFRNIQQVEELLVPVFRKMLAEQDAARDKAGSKVIEDSTNTCLSWLCELADGKERDPVTLVHSQILLALGAIHTSLFAELNLLFDLMSNPAEIETIRSEVSDVAKSGWTYKSYSELYKLDSMLRESQRLTPPFMIGLRRVIKQKHTFANGFTVHPGQYVCVFTPSVQNARLHPDERPDVFYGLRSYDKKAKEDALQSHKHQFSTVDASVLGFGHGRTACPGRWSASLALKIVFAKLMTEYDFQYLDGKTTRPASLLSNEIVSPDRRINIRVRKRSTTLVPY